MRLSAAASVALALGFHVGLVETSAAETSRSVTPTMTSPFPSSVISASSMPSSSASATASSVNVGPAGAFEKLSPANQKIARALFEAQRTTTSASRPLSLDDIAAMKQSGRGWGVIFKHMTSRGLVDANSLGEVVSRYQRQHAHR